jgi:hypothetical protein
VYMLLLSPSLARPGLFIYSSGRDSPPPPSVLRSPHPLCNVSLLFLLLITQFLFFPRVGVGLSRGLCWSGPGLSVEVPHTALLTLSMSSQAVWAQATGGGPGALLVSPFNMKWRFSVQAGGVEVSKFCLFSVALPARCVSSISPRFHYRRHAFCFLPLATILESLIYVFLHCCAGWKNIVAFIKILTMCQLYHTWIHLIHLSFYLPGILLIVPELITFMKLGKILFCVGNF